MDYLMVFGRWVLVSMEGQSNRWIHSTTSLSGNRVETVPKPVYVYFVSGNQNFSSLIQVFCRTPISFDFDWILYISEWNLRVDGKFLHKTPIKSDASSAT